MAFCDGLLSTSKHDLLDGDIAIAKGRLGPLEADFSFCSSNCILRGHLRLIAARS